jgi:3-methyladenine DNA glycosylase/8-oxoguanine DNA glycosylase
VNFRFYPQPPYDFALTADASRYYSTLHRLENGALRRTLRIGDQVVLVRAASTGTVDQPVIDVEVEAASGTVSLDQVELKLRRWLAIDGDLRAFYAAANRDPALAETVRKLRGLHLLRTDSLFEAAVVTMIEQQIALKAAQRAEHWMIQTYGDVITHMGRAYPVFPAAARLAALDEAALTPLKITFVRIRRLLALAQHETALESLLLLDGDSAYRGLIAYAGIGHWTAAWTLIRALGHYRYVGSGDVALRAAVNAYWHGLPGKAPTAETDAIFARFAPHDGLASVYTLIRWGIERYPKLGVGMIKTRRAGGEHG